MSDVRVCAECDSGQEIKVVGPYGDGLDYCEACRAVEGKTRDVSEEEWEQMQ